MASARRSWWRGPDHVRVAYLWAGRSEALEADRLVCAIPFPVLRDVEVVPPFSREKRRAIATLPYSSITRIYLQARRRYWEDEGLSGFAYADLPVPRVLVHPLARRTGRGILEAHVGKAEARRLAELPEDERIAFALDLIERIHPGMHDHFEGGASCSWVTDPWARSGYSSFGPGQMFELLPAIARPEGEVHFAVEHTSKMAASMEGALESGNRAAHEVSAVA